MATMARQENLIISLTVRVSSFTKRYRERFCLWAEKLPDTYSVSCKIAFCTTFYFLLLKLSEFSEYYYFFNFISETY